jgi:MFS family permease
MDTKRFSLDTTLTLIAAYLGLFVGLIDANAINVALPAIRDNLGGGISGAQYAYNITFAAVLLTAGSLGDRFGRRMLLRVGLVTFIAASLVCAAAPSLPLLLAARAVQGVGAAVMLAQGLAITAAAFRNAIEGGRATAAWAMAAAMSTAIGPILGGVLTDSLGWRYIFWLNAPVGVLALLMTYRYLPESRDPDAASFDVAGQTLAMLGLGALTIVLVVGATMAPAWTVALGVVAVAGIAAFVCSQRRAARPMLPLELFGSRRLVAALVATFTMTFGIYGLLLVNSFAFQQQRGAGALATALWFLPMPLTYLVLIPVVNARPPHGSAAADDGRVDHDGRGHGALCRGGTAGRRVVARAVVRAGRCGPCTQHRPRRRAGDVGRAGAAGGPGLGRGESGTPGGYHCRCGGVG